MTSATILVTNSTLTWNLEPQKCKTREILSGSRSRKKARPYEEGQGKGDEENEMNEGKKIEDRMCAITLFYEGLITIN